MRIVSKTNKHSSHLASHARARYSVVTVTGDCCGRFPRSFAAVVAADVAMPDACVNGRKRGSRFDAFNSGGAGGLLPVCKSTSYHLDVCSQGPTGRKKVKGGVSGPAEDLLPFSEEEAGVNFRPAGSVRGQVAGSLPRSQPGTFTRQVKGSVVTPSLHPEVSGIQFVSLGYGLDIRQSMDEGVWNHTVGDLDAKG